MKAKLAVDSEKLSILTQYPSYLGPQEPVSDTLQVDHLWAHIPILGGGDNAVGELILWLADRLVLIEDSHPLISSFLFIV